MNYRINEIVESLFHLVGWDGGANEINKELTNSDSGLFFQEAHPLLTLRAVRAIAPENLLAKYPEWPEGGATCVDGSIWRYGDTAYLYRGSEQFISSNPTENENFSEWNNLSEYISDLTKRGIKKAIQRFVRDKVIGLESRNIIDRRCLFDGTGRIDSRIDNHSRLVGFEITPLRSNGIVTKIDKVGLQFAGNTGTIKLYLFHSSVREPLATKEVNYTKTNGTFVWEDVENWVLPYVSEGINAGGSFYVVYNQAALPDFMEAINFNRDWSREPCGTCNKGDLQLYRLMQKYVTFSPFYVAVDNWDGNLWDIEQNIYSASYNWGMNIMFTMGCDLTETIIAMRNEFSGVIQMQVASDTLRTIALNPEVSVNRVQYNADRDQILYETDGNGEAIKGLHGDLEKSYKALSIDTRGLDPVCLGCHNKGIRIGSI